MAAKFHYSRETPPDAVFTDIQTLNKFDLEPFQKLSAIVFEFLLDPLKSADLLGNLEEFANEQGVSSAALKNVIKSLLTIPDGALKNSVTPEQLEADLNNLGLSEEKSTHFSQIWQSNVLALSKGALSQTLMVNQLVDMEWKFGVTAASSDVNKVGNTFIQLKLVINKGNKTENVYMELTLPQFYSFLHEMEKAKASLDFFS